MITVWLLAALAAPPELPTVGTAAPDEALNALFRRREGWIGADGAFSVPLSDTRSLWLFSDTWVGRIDGGRRKPVAMVNNSVGVMDGVGAKAQLTFHIPKNANDKPAALFVPPDGQGWFWLFAGHFANDQLHIFLPRMEKTGRGGAFGFRGVDLWLGTVSNPEAQPSRWKITYTKVPCADLANPHRKIAFGSAVLATDEYTYVYGYEETPGKLFPTRRLLTARVPPGKLTDFTAWRFLANGTWTTTWKDATPQADGLATEFSVSYVRGLQQYALVYTEWGLSDRIVGRFARSPEGPWSEPLLLYRCPEAKDKTTFTYAGKAHPQLAGERELVISYAVNAFELAPVVQNAELYWPTFVRVQLK
ncbi:MAG: DUF4185 domain-containing protein [Gemmataceae bacterium]|nr:DUF4185 domain-containing protein [Gemmata sp.]MDW8199562.1 DUF4185 domain-containing protein [Gemmataceae bacterium]